MGGGEVSGDELIEFEKVGARPFGVASKVLGTVGL